MTDLRDVLAIRGFSPLSADDAPVPVLGALSALEASLDDQPEKAREAALAARLRVARLHESVQKALHAGVKPRDFPALQALLAACQAAHEVLDSIGAPNDRALLSKFGHSETHKGVVS